MRQLFQHIFTYRYCINFEKTVLEQYLRKRSIGYIWLNGELTKEHLSDLYKPNETQVNQLDESIPELQAEIDFKRIQLNSSDYVLAKTKALYTEWTDMQFAQKRAIAETVTEYITIGQDTINIALAYLPRSGQTSQRNFTGKCTGQESSVRNGTDGRMSA